MMRKGWIIILVVGLLVGVAFYLATALNYKEKTGQLDIEISSLLKKYPVSRTDTLIVKEYLFEEPQDIEDIIGRLKRLIQKYGLDVLRDRTEYKGGKTSYILEVGREFKTFYVLKLVGIEPFRKAPIVPKRPSAKVAIVLDDWGYNMNNIELLNSIDIPLTISILPGLAYSTRIAKEQHANKNREIILHMPMEPEDETIRLEKDTLFTSMDKDEILSLLRTSLKTVPYAKGLSNHMGSKATQDKGLIRVVMEELRRKRLYFLDSLATPKTICQEGAKELKIRFVTRDIFLDNLADKRYISVQMDKLMKLARRRGFAVGVGHDRIRTLEVIKEKAGQISDYDIEFVFVSELARKHR